jgi:CRP-like cAMP-binding protein
MPIRRRQDPDWSCRRCPAGSGACCGALLRGAGRLTVDKRCLIRQSTSSVGPDEIAYHAGATANAVFAVCQGWALRFVALPDGRRQNLAVLLPGDLSVGALFQDQLHYSVAAVTPLRITQFPGADLKRRILGDAELLDIFGRACAEEQRDIDQRAVNLGRRSAEERVAHLLLGLVERMSQHGARPDHAYQLPLLQRHIADLTGLTPVHVSRVTTEFRNAGLMRFAQGFLTILDLAGVQQIAQLR